MENVKEISYCSCRQRAQCPLKYHKVQRWERVLRRGRNLSRHPALGHLQHPPAAAYLLLRWILTDVRKLISRLWHPLTTGSLWIFHISAGPLDTCQFGEGDQIDTEKNSGNFSQGFCRPTLWGCIKWVHAFSKIWSLLVSLLFIVVMHSRKQSTFFIP